MVKHHEVGLWRRGHSDALFNAFVDIDLHKRTLSSHSVMLLGELWAACLELIAAAAAATRTGCVEKLHSLFPPVLAVGARPPTLPKKTAAPVVGVARRWFYHSVQHTFWASLSRSCQWPVWIHPAEGHFQKCLPLSVRFARQMVHEYIHTCCHSWVKFFFTHLAYTFWDFFFFVLLWVVTQHQQQASTRQQFPGTAVTFTSSKLCILHVAQV